MNTIYSLLLNYSYTTLLSHTHMYIPTYITIYSDIDVSIMCTPYTLCIHMYVYILYHSLDLYFPIYKYIIPTYYITYSIACLLYTSPSPRDATLSRMPSSA